MPSSSHGLPAASRASGSADASAAQRARKPVPSAAAGGTPGARTPVQRYDALAAAQTLCTHWRKAKADIATASDFADKAQRLREALDLARDSMAQYRAEYAKSSTRDKKTLIGQADTLNVAVYDVCVEIMNSIVPSLPGQAQAAAQAQIDGGEAAGANYAELRRIAQECRAVADDTVNNPLGHFFTERQKRLDDNDFKATITTGLLAGRIFMVTNAGTQRHDFGPTVSVAQSLLSISASLLMSLASVWLRGLSQKAGGSELERNTLHLLDQQLDDFQRSVESFADAVAAELNDSPAPVRNAALKVVEAANDLISTLTTVVDLKWLADELGASRRESSEAQGSSSSDFAVALPEPRKPPQASAPKQKSRSRSKRSSNTAAAQQPVVATSRPAPDPRPALKKMVDNALERAPVTLGQLQSFGGSPVEVARSMGLRVVELDYTWQASCLAIENTVSNFVHDKLGNRKALATVLGKVETALAQQADDIELKGWQAELADRLEALDQMHAWARNAQSDAVKNHGAPRRWHLEYLLDTGQLAVERPRALPSSSDSGDGRATLFEMVLHPTPLSEGQPAQPLYVHLHTPDDAPITEDQCHALDFKHFTAVHVKTHADRNKGRGWMQVQVELARQAAGSSGGEVIVPPVHRGRVEAPLLERLRTMAA